MKVVEGGREKKIVTLGDLMLDKYEFFKENGPSPEFEGVTKAHAIVEKGYEILGGAANVALNTANLGRDSILIGGINSDDYAGRRIIEICSSMPQAGRNLTLESVHYDDGEPTTLKMRLFKMNCTGELGAIPEPMPHRLDYERQSPVSDNVTQRIIDRLDDLSPQDTAAIIVSDYNKGIVTRNLLEKLREIRGIPIFADFKPREETLKLEGIVDVVKPNWKEFLGYLELTRTPHDELEEGNAYQIEEAGRRLRDELGCDILLTTGNEGIRYFGDGVPSFVRAIPIQKEPDVVGAGDTTIATFSIMRALGHSVHESLMYTVAAGHLTVSNPGNYAPTIDEVKEVVDKHFQPL